MLTDEEMRAVIQDNLDLLDDPQKAVKLLYKVAKAQEKDTMKKVREILEGIKELTKEERDAVYDNLSTDATCGDERQAYCQAQLQACKEQILEKLE